MAYRDNHLSDREYRSSGRKAGAEKKQFRHTSDMEYRKSRKASKRQGAKNFREKHSLKELLTGVLCTVDHRKQSVLLLPTGITNIPLQYPRYLQRIQIPMTNIS